jgi:hypothetical protein
MVQAVILFVNTFTRWLTIINGFDSLPVFFRLPEARTSECNGRLLGGRAPTPHAVTRYQPRQDKITRMHAQTAMIENGFVHCPTVHRGSQPSCTISRNFPIAGIWYLHRERYEARQAGAWC